MMNRLTGVLVACALAFSAVPVWAEEATIEGTVSGYLCAVLGKACPVDKEDPLVAAEKTFVVVQSDGGFYQVPNVDRAVLARHLTEKVRVKGTVDSKYKSVNATSIEVMDKDKWKVFWSTAMEAEMRRMLNVEGGP